MQNSAPKLTRSGEMETHKLAWLKSLGLADDKSVIDCDPTAQTVLLDDGRTRQVTDVYTRVMGYHRPIEYWNKGKQQEHRDRQMFQEPRQ